MKFSVVSLSVVKDDYYWRLHKAGCKDIDKDRSLGPVDTFDAPDVKAAVNHWIDADLVDMGYGPHNVKVLSCAKGV